MQRPRDANQAALAWSGLGDQFQGSSWSTRLIGWSAMRAMTSASQASGSTSSGLDERVHDRGAPAALVGAGEEIVLAPEGERTDGALGRVVGHFEPSVVDEAGESGPARGRVANSAGERALAADPGQRRIEEGLQVGQNRRRAALPGFPALGRTAPANVGLDGEQSGDSFQRLACGGRTRLAMHVVDFAPGVGPTGDFGQAGNAGLRLGFVKSGEAGVAVGVEEAATTGE